jgi:hypothetical protein
MTLEEWQKNKWLKREPSSGKEIADLLGLVERNLRDAEVDLISLDARLQFVFNAALISATIALRATGYRVPAIEGHHEKTLNSLKFTLGYDSSLIARLNGFRKKRGNIVYDMAGTTSQSEFDDLHELTVALFDHVRNWLSDNYPEFYKKS